MSKTSIKERNKAIRLAWEREQKLVSVGKGTRNWSQEQQKDILDPNKGKAYDENGRAFEGQHMKSAAEYPEHQGNPDNIQFLTREEHLEAHKGSWQNPTNWYYDPVTKDYIDFGEGDFFPCKEIKLSDPVSSIESITIETEKDDAVKTQNADITKEQGLESKPLDNSSDASALTQTPLSEKTISKTKSLFGRIGQFFTDNPRLIERVKTAGIIISGLAVALVAVKAASGSSSDSSDSGNDYSPRDPYDDDNGDSAYDVTSKISNERSSPEEHTVPAHGQHYHTKDGVIWREKEPYQRGGKKDD